MQLNDIVFGNPNNEIKKLISTPCLVSDLFYELENEPFPKNDTALTKNELEQIVANLKIMQSPENSDFVRRYKSYDRNVLQVIISTFREKGINVEELVHQINSDIYNLVLRLKYFYNRPRPAQLAAYYKLALFPFPSFNGNNSPSYPSMQAVQANVILNVIGNKNPNEYNFCKEMISDVYFSREYLGLNYGTDNDFANLVSQSILKNNLFTKKYQI